ncbi:MAG: RNA-binding transcriptional accessory protein, partial [Clostridia bacterium]|nr:RNA-binding transcriptional accessory protein [Clostridia bacterium]
MNILQTLADELNIPLDRLTATVDLLDAGNTVPFVARYRKEVTGGLDDTVLRNLMDRLTALRNLEKRKDEVRALI